jgi:hypothetical protein
MFYRLIPVLHQESISKKKGYQNLITFKENLFQLLLRVNRFNRANICACATISANLRINHVNITFFNCFNRALIDAGAASSTIFIYFVRHDANCLLPENRLG